MAKRLGIDLGTTYSSVSYVEGDGVETIELEAANGSKFLPSVVYYPQDGSDPVVDRHGSDGGSNGTADSVGITSGGHPHISLLHPSVGRCP